MFEVREISLVALAAVLTLAAVVDAADARGGSRGKGARGRSGVPAAHMAVPGVTPAASATAVKKLEAGQDMN